MRELKDSHSFFWNYKQNCPEVLAQTHAHARFKARPSSLTSAAGSEAYAKGLRPGAVITRIDGQSVAEKVEQLRPALPAYSSERILLATAYKYLLRGEKGSTVKVTFRPPGHERGRGD